MKWNKVSENELPFGEEVIAFNEKWIDEDFNPIGIIAYDCAERNKNQKK